MLLRNPVIVLAGLWVLLVHAAPSQSADVRTLLSDKSNDWSPSTKISFPGGAGFENATLRWTTFDAPTYAAAVSPGNEADVAKVVKIASSYKIPFLATGARHGYTTTLGELQGGLAIDLGQLRSYSIDSNAETVTVGAASTIADIEDALYAAGLIIQSGSASCPSYIGLTLGSGVGRFTGLFGLVADALLSARLVTADGRIVDVSATQNSDLFWGLRGAGANLGVITSATFKAHKFTNGGQLMSADFAFPANLTKDYFDVLASFSGKMPAKLAVVSVVNYNPQLQSTIVLANWVYVGPKEEGLKAIAPVLALNPPVANISELPWNTLIPTAGGGFDAILCQKNLSRNFYSSNLRQLSSATFQTTFEKVADYHAKYPEARGTAIDLETFPNQAMMAVPDDSSAYPWRDAVGYIQISVLTDSTTATGSPAATAGDQLGRDLRTLWASTSGYPALSVYINYAHGDEQLGQKYGDRKLPRLAGLKKKWDPDNVFAYNNALPTKYP